MIRRFEVLRRFERLILPIFTFIVIVFLWDLITARLQRVEPLFLPPPTTVFREGLSVLSKANFWTLHVATTMQELFLGYFVAIGLAIPVGFLIGRWRRIALAIEPFVIGFYSMPRVALIPLIILWFGIGIEQKIAMIVMGAFFPMCINTIAGVRRVDPFLIRVARVFGANTRQEMVHITFPSSLPFLFAGARIALISAFLLAIFAEMYSARAGLGFLISYAGNMYQTGPLIVLIIITMVLGVALNQFLTFLEHKAIRY